VFPLFTVEMFDAMGYGGGNSVGVSLKSGPQVLNGGFVTVAGWAGNCVGNPLPCLDVL
jgi:hypothetical protein